MGLWRPFDVCLIDTEGNRGQLFTLLYISPGNTSPNGIFPMKKLFCVTNMVDILLEPVPFHTLFYLPSSEQKFGIICGTILKLAHLAMTFIL